MRENSFSKQLLAFYAGLLSLIPKMVPGMGLEPIRLAAQDFKSRVSADSTIRAPL